jgi:hypothetical protein
MPDFTVEVVRWGATEDGALIEIHLEGTLGRRSVAWEAVDRLVVRDGLIVARHSYFDPLPVALRLMRSPRLALTMLRRGR